MDVLRGFAMLAVVAIHTTAEFAWLDGLSALVVTNIVLDVFFQYAVPLFVLISGFVLARRYGRVESPVAFYVRRARAILPPYVVFSLLYVLFSALRGISVTLGDVVFRLLTATSYYHLWFIAIIVQFYILYPVILGIYRRFRARDRVTVFLIVALLGQLSWNVLKLVFLDGPGGGQVVYGVTAEQLLDRVFVSHVFYFALGIHLGQPFESWRHKAQTTRLGGPIVVSFTLAVTVSLFWIARVVGYGHFYDAPQRTLIVPVLLGPFLYVSIAFLLFRLSLYVARVASLGGCILASLGRLSLGVYLIHEFYRFVAVYLLRRVGVTNADWLFYPLVFTATIVASYLSVKVIGYLPYSEWVVGVHQRLPWRGAN
ncbi:MAG: acyltransferase [candidate division KSB1 bacterium]|nr:acyltransferase [candidate division KSB1 bacterium]